MPTDTIPQVPDPPHRARRPGRRSARAAATLVGAVALVALAVGCGSDADDRPSAEEGAAPPPAGLTTTTPARLDRLVELDRPTQVAARAGTDHLYATLQADGVAVLLPNDDGTYTQAPDLLIDRTEADFDPEEYVEAGVLGLTFSQDGSLLYLVESMPTGHLQNPRQVEWRLLEYALDGDEVVEGSERVLLSIIKERPVHNAGQVRFGPDGYLYVGLGDGWPVGDELESGQDPSTLLGTIMRIDPTPAADGTPYSIPRDNPFADGVDGAPEVWLYGVRNPWRFSWDPTDDDLWLTDVGDATVEEINRIPSGADRGANLGWSEVEGSQPFEGGTTPEGAIVPIYEYEHAPGFCAIIGGALMPESVLPGYAGWFLFSDFCALEVFAIDPAADPVERVGLVGTDLSVTSIETLSDERVMVTTLDGLHQLVADD